MKLKILFLGGAKRISLAKSFIENVKKYGKTCEIYSYELSYEIPISFIGKIIIGKKWNDHDVINDIEKIILKYKIDILIPSVDPATIIASKIKFRGKTNCFIPVSEEKLCQIFFDKNKSYNWALEKKIPVPSSKIKFPIIAKPIYGSASKGMQILKNKNDLLNFNKNFKISNFNLQQFIRGKEYSVDVYVSLRTKKIITIVPRIRIETLGGESIKTVTTNNPILIELTENIVLKSGLVGPLVVQFIQDFKTKKFYLMEINPRLGGAVICSILAGANFTDFILRDFFNKKISENKKLKWKNNFMMIRYFSEFYKTVK